MGLLGTGTGAALGAVIGSFIPGVGWALGFSIGASIGALVSAGDPPGVNVGKLNELRVSGASFGDPIRRTYGTMRQPIQIIWTSGLIEKKSTKKEGGGLFTSGTEVTTYKYSADLACLICEGPIQGIRKIWMNSKLVYNLGDDADGASIAASLEMAKSVTIYTGTETQDPDPYLEEQIGVGLTPAHRGYAYIVIEGLKLKQYGNRIPNIEVEVVVDTAGDSAPNIVNGYTGSNTIEGRSSGRLDGGTILTASETELSARNFDHEIRRYDFDGNLKQYTKYEIRIDDATNPVSADAYVINNVPEALYITSLQPPYHSRLYWKGQEIALLNFTGGNVGPLDTEDFEAYGRNEHKNTRRGNDNEYYIVATDKAGGSNGLIRYLADIYGRPTYNYDKASYFTDLLNDSRVNTDTNFWIYPDAENPNEFWVWDTQAVLSASPSEQFFLVRYDIDFNVLAKWSKDTTGIYGGNQISNNMLIGPGYCLVKQSSTSQTAILYTFDHETDESEWSSASASLDNTGTYGSFLPLGNALVATKYEIVTRLPIANSGGQNLSDVVEDICLDSGYESSDVDVTGLTGTVKGFSIPRPESARSSIEQLQKTNWFDGAEYDSKIHWIMRGGSSIATLTEDDLAAHDINSQLPDLTNIQRESILELPHTMSMQFLDPDLNHEQNSAYSRKRTTTGNHIATISVNVALDIDDATQACDVLLYNSHQEIEVIEFHLSDKYHKFVPTDLITIPINGTNQLVRIVEKQHSKAGFSTYRAVPEDTSIYTQARKGVTTGTTGDVLVGINGAAFLAFMDLPMLTQADDHVGVYAGAVPFLTTWQAHTLWRFMETLSSWVELASFVDQATGGSVTTALPDARVGVIDWTNTLTVRVANSSMTLTSSTEETVLVDGSVNRFALINPDGVPEICQFITATDNADGTYDLDGLVRGLFGTEYATTEHTTSDFFVMIDVLTIQRLEMESGDIGQEYRHRFVGEDEDFDLVDPLPLTVEGYSVMPWNPVHLAAAQSGSPADWDISWVPRSRYNYIIDSDVDYVDDPEIISYTVDIIDTSSPESVVRSTDVTVGTEIFTYTNAMQVTDFGSTQANITFIVYAKGTTFGEGYGMRYETANETSTIVTPKA